MIFSEQKRFFLIAMVWNWIIGWLGMYAFAQVQPDCDFRYNLQYGQQQILQSPGYDQGMYYGPNKVCRWIYTGPPGTVFDVTCNPIDIPVMQNYQCPQDRLVVSLSGAENLSDGTNYCGTTPIKQTSFSNKLSIGFVSREYSNGGRYRCIITPIVSGSVPPTKPTTTTTTRRPNTNCDCGWRQQRRIVGGDETKVNEYAFMAGVIDLGKGIVWCGASIISNNYAITAAHCLYQKQISQYGLLVGDHNIKQATETNSAALYQLIDYNIHESYNSRTQQNDIAIVQTDRPITFSLNVGPICLPYRYTTVDFTYAPVTTMGWGSLFFTGPTSDALRAVNLTVANKQECQKKYSGQQLYSSQICTYGYMKDSCSFDSGGPVVWFDTANTFRYQLLGIVSFGKDCATDAPGVNTNVPSYINWILNATPRETYCFL